MVVDFVEGEDGGCSCRVKSFRFQIPGHSDNELGLGGGGSKKLCKNTFFLYFRRRFFNQVWK